MRTYKLAIAIILIFSACNSIDGYKKDKEINNGGTIPEGAIPIIYNNYLHVIVSVDSIQGSFLIDTAADILLLDSIFVSKNNLTYKNFHYRKIWGIGESYQIIPIIKDTVCFNIGNKKFQSSFVPIIEMKPIGGDYVDGLIGTDFFQNKYLEINYTGKYINVFNSVDSAYLEGYNSIKMGRIDHFYTVPAVLKVNDSVTIEGSFALDTGMPLSTITSSFAEKYDLINNVNRKVRYYAKYGGVGGETAGYDFIIDTLEILNLNLESVNMSFSTDMFGLLANDSYIGILGNNVLDRFDVLFDFKNDILYYRPNEKFKTSYVFDRLGFSYVDRSKTMGGWVIAGITESSPAEKNGLMIDDLVITVNGIPIEKIPYEYQKEFFKKIDKVEFVVRRNDVLKKVEFELAPLL